jgi:hypothetical protein
MFALAQKERLVAIMFLRYGTLRSTVSKKFPVKQARI